MRVVICDDSALFRKGLALLLDHVGVTVVAQAGDTAELASMLETRPADAAVVDVRMPPTFTDEGLVAAVELKKRYPALGVLVLSTYAEGAFAARLLEASPRGVGYLLKDRVDDAAALRDALERVASGGVAVDPEIVGQLFELRRAEAMADRLTPRERDVLRLMAEGRSNAAIARTLFLGAKTVEAHIAAVLNKLDLSQTPDDNRRVLAVLTWLRMEGTGAHQNRDR
ncbi:response regulator transcription factor [Microbispora sp. ATCC PTA-5024]|uniref:response regulator transcription factor n=1 Tax=Microbispora sp. ATCC PTA-5024 TaxID=316330 RepID=UPI0003DD8388|nr:response regulator transcription factor [Microbispora sp. ATCC PTA-5024]ETK36424.1 LuxR family transcriptional regulator [Microbispora sp. ATCC PTA-5024]